MTSIKLILKVDLGILFFSLFFIPLYLAIGFTEGIYILIFSAVCAIVFPLILNRLKSLMACAHFFAFASLSVFASHIYFSGGIYSPYFIWLLTIPPIGFLYMHTRAALFWLGITITVGLFFLGISLSNIELVNRFPSEYLPVIITFSFAMVLSLFTYVVVNFQSSYRYFNHKLKKTNDDLKQSNTELERFAYIASHDLKSPLRNIVSFSNLLHMQCSDKLGPEGLEYLKFIEKNSRQMHMLIEDILEYSSTINREYQQQKVDLNEVISDISTQLEMDKKYAAVEISYPKLPIINADSTLIHQLFQNLIENGLKYNKNEAPKVELNYKEKQGGKIEFSIGDNGIGIKPAYQKDIFKMFKRLHNHEEYSGTGIGLAICKRIVAQYQGELWLESEEGKGSVFFFDLPVASIEMN